MSVTINPTLRAELDARHRVLMLHAAEAGAMILHERLGSTSHGTGTHHSDLPHRSSAYGQYPVLQFGDLQGGVSFRSAEGTMAQITIEDDFQKIVDLEFGAGDNPFGTALRGAVASGAGRAPMWRTFTDAAVIAQMNQAINDTP